MLLASLHRKLHSPQRAAKGFEVVAREVLLDLFRGTGCAHLRLEVRADPIPLPADVVMTLILIATEITTNAVKHAFSQGNGTRFTVELRRVAENRAELVFTDDGPGFPDAIEHAAGLGRKILDSLVRQLDGCIDLRSDGGAVVTVAFPLSPRAVHCEPDNRC